jgi:predicted DNA repair protein MutK
VAVLVGIALLLSVGVYGLVAGIVKLDDVGLHLARRRPGATLARLSRMLGEWIVRATPWLMKGLSIAGTAAMFLVGGGILTHGVPVMHRAIEDWSHEIDDIPGIGAVFGALGPMLVNALAGIAAGALVYAVLALVKRMRAPATTQAH